MEHQVAVSRGRDEAKIISGRDEVCSNRRADEARNMSYRLLENGNRPTADVEDGTEARLALEALVDSAGLRNIVLALARFTSDRSEKLAQQDPATAACWLQSARALLRCGAEMDTFWQPREEINTSRRAATAERVGTQLASVVKRWLR